MSNFPNSKKITVGPRYHFPPIKCLILLLPTSTGLHYHSIELKPSMDDSKNNENSSDIDEFLGFDCKNNLKSQKIFTDLMKSSLVLDGADKVLMARKLPRTLLKFDSDPCKINKVCTEPKNSVLQSSSKQGNDISECNVDDYVDVSNMVNSPSGGYNEFLLNILIFVAVILLKMVGFQMNLFVRFFIFPIRLSYFSVMFLMFPFQTLSRVRARLVKKLLGMRVGLYLSVTSFTCNKFKVQKLVLNLAIRVGWAFFWSIYVWFLLVGLLVWGFIIGGLTMRRLVEEPIQTTEALNFDYTRASPVAFFPIMKSSNGVGHFSGLMWKEGVEAENETHKRFIPYNHKVELTVSLTLPESEYNRKLGVFQVRVEFLSTTGKVTASSSYPCMLRFKSQSIRFAETIFKGIPLVTGFQSEVQNLNIKITDFTEGYDPTASLRVILEQRAEYQSGAGLPEIYSATVALESKLPQFKRIVWFWRRTIFVWISITSFLMELMVVLIFCRPIILPRGRSLVLLGRAKKNVEQTKIF